MITAEIIADSISIKEDRLTTFELEYPRFIHSEVMTHRMFSRNAASSRAIPINKMIEQVEQNPATPVEWGLNKAGMQAEAVHNDTDKCLAVWQQAAVNAVNSAAALKALGLHKQIVNRVLEPFQWMKTIVTATEFDNFFWLRCHQDAQPEIKVLAETMLTEYINSTPLLLEKDQWHLPYIGQSMKLTLEEAKKISSSCCAQVSYRKLDDSIEKATKIYDQLVTMTPVHASPFEHIATPLYSRDQPEVTHMDKNGALWSGNLKGWAQYRQSIDGHTCKEYFSASL